MSTATITLDEFNNFIHQLNRHDWTYMYSDDHRVWQRGNYNQEQLYITATQHPTYKEAFKAYQDRYFSLPALTKEQLDQRIAELRFQLEK